MALRIYPVKYFSFNIHRELSFRTQIPAVAYNLLFELAVHFYLLLSRAMLPKSTYSIPIGSSIGNGNSMVLNDPQRSLSIW